MTVGNHKSLAQKSPFGDALVRFRTELGLTQEGLAETVSRVSGERISSRSITNYERSVSDPRNWTLPHRPTLRTLAQALQLDPAQHRHLSESWNLTKARKDSAIFRQEGDNFVLDGRSHVLESLQSSWQKARTGRPQLVLLGAEVGLGKTSLARYFCDTIAGSSSPVMVSWGDASSRGSTLEPYGPVRRATDRMLVTPPTTYTFPGIYQSRPTLAAQTVLEIMPRLPKLAKVLVSERTVIDLGELIGEVQQEELDRILAPTVGMDSIGRWDEYTQLLMRLAQDWPILVVLEDLQWSGELTVQLLAHLHDQMKHMHNVSLMVVGTVRTDDMPLQNDGSPNPLRELMSDLFRSPAGNYVSMADVISPHNGRSFIRGLLRKYQTSTELEQEGLVEWLYAHTSGQPIYATEMIRHLQEVHSLRFDSAKGNWIFDADVIPTNMPAAISNFIGRRIARLPTNARHVLEVAAVMGETILPNIVATVLGMSEESILELIDNTLVNQHRLLVPSATFLTRTHSHVTYRFLHALHREYVYASLPAARIRSLHGNIALVLSEYFDDAETIAMGAITNHFSLAEDWVGAEMAAFRTAQLCLTRLDWELTRFWFDRSEELALHARDSEHLWKTRSARLAFLRGTGEYAEALKLGERILNRVSHHNWPSVEALARHHIGEVQYDLGELERASEQLEVARNLHLQTGQIELAAAAAAMLSHTWYRRGQYDVARDHARQSLEIARATAHNWVLSESLLALANCSIDLGFYQEALDHYNMAIESAKMIGKVVNQFIPAMNAGLCLVLLGRLDEAIAELTELIDSIQTRASNRLLAPPNLYLGMAFEAKGMLTEARNAYQRATDLRESRDATELPVPTLYDSLAGLLRVAILQGESETVGQLTRKLHAFVASGTWEVVEDPLQLMMTYANGLKFLGQCQESCQALTTAHDLLMRRASHLSDAEALNSYLTRVPINVEIQRQFAELGT